MNEVRQPLDRLFELANGYRAAQVLLAAVRLELFTTLHNQTLTARQLASALSANERAIRVLCDALVALELLDKQGAAYRNSALALEYLCADSPQGQTAILRHNARLYAVWGQLAEVVKSGSPVDRSQLAPGLAATEQDFARAMADSALHLAAHTAQALDLSRYRSLLDLGGGPGVYAREFARRYPELRVTLLDNARTLEIAREILQQAGLESRVTCRAGDALLDDLGHGWDCIFLSNLIHSYGPEENRRLLRKCAGALSAGGCVAVKDFYLNSDRTSPVGASLFAINMLVNTPSGDCYTVGEVEAWLREARLTVQPVIPLDSLSRLVVATRGARPQDG